MKKGEKLLKFVVFAALTVSFFVVLPQHLRKTQSANVLNVSDTLSSSRFSFYGLLGAGNTEGSSVVTINTTTAPSTSAGQLASPSASTVTIGNHAYTLSAIMPNNDESKFGITTGLLTGEATAGIGVIATQSATHTIKFKTSTPIANGIIRVLIPAAAANANDGIPDRDGFDFSATTPTVTCPSDVSSDYDFVTGVATASAVTINGSLYHSFICAYSGNGVANTVFDGTTNSPLIVTSLINPAPKTSHAQSTADAYKIIVQNTDNAYTAIDQTTAQVGIIESVRVTATVAPQITFKIAGIPSGVSGSTACGTNTSVTTTATSVPFGEVSISAFTFAAQSLEVSTNAVGGYVVTAQENDNLGKNGRACVNSPLPADCIPDTTGNGANITYGAKGRWDSASYKGFGYGLKKITTSGTAAFEYTDTDANCSGGTFCAKKFADLQNNEPAQTIFSSTTVADQENVDVCYKLVVGSTQAAGDYENHIVYTATATF